MSKHSRSGGKFTGRHTTLIPLAATVCDIAEASPSVTKISPGFIKAGLKSANGQRGLKITERKGGILLSVRDNTSHQEIHIYVKNMRSATIDIEHGARNRGLRVTFAEE